MSGSSLLSYPVVNMRLTKSLCPHPLNSFCLKLPLRLATVSLSPSRLRTNPTPCSLLWASRPQDPPSLGLLCSQVWAFSLRQSFCVLHCGRPGLPQTAIKSGVAGVGWERGLTSVFCISIPHSHPQKTCIRVWGAAGTWLSSEQLSPRQSPPDAVSSSLENLDSRKMLGALPPTCTYAFT